MNPHLQRALILLEQSRSDLAEAELRQALAADPDDAFAHALLADCLCDREKLDAATDEAKRAIHLAPEMARAHAVLARVLHERNYFKEAEAAILEALRLEPDNANHYALLALIRMNRREWAPALEAAEQGLERDPENLACNNLRAMALVKLGRREEAGQTMAATLARDPEEAYSHANQGWALLHQGESKKALEHFREALRLEPDLEFARAGIVEALKARNFIYALFLRYFLWMGTLSGRAQWAIVLGGFFGYRFLSSFAGNNPAWEPWLRPILIAYIVFAVMTWIAQPLFNLLLRLHPFGRHALSREQTVAANWFAVLVFPALGFLAMYFLTDFPLSALGLAGAGFFGLLIIPTAAVFYCESGWPRRAMTLYTLGLAAVGLAVVPALMLAGEELFLLLGQVFIVGSFLSQFVANGLAMATPRR